MSCPRVYPILSAWTPRRALFLSAILATVFALPAVPDSCLAGLHAHASAAADQSSSGTLVKDSGKFRDLVNGQQVGREDFQIGPAGSDWVAHGSADVQGPDGKATHVTGTLRMQSDGTPLHYEWSAQGPKKASATIDFQNGRATIVLRVQGSKPFTEQFFFSPRVVILDDNLYHQYAILADRYDWAKKGPQEFPVLIPQEMTPGTITVEALEPQKMGGKRYDRLRVRSEDLELELYLSGRRLERVVSPSSNAQAIRE